MPALPFVPNVVSAVMVGLNGTTRWANIFHLHYSTSAPTTADLISVGTQLSQAWSTNFGPDMLNTVQVTSVTVTDLSSSTGAQGISTITRTGAATPASPLPANCAAVISWAINARYRGGRPRTYLPARNQADTSNMQFWTGTYQGALASAAGLFLTAVNGITAGGNTYTLVSVAYHRNKVLLAVPLVFNISGAAVHPRIDSQRRRLGKEVR